ncbi:hypothetical protein CPB83DRAFT_807585 [Crepidotus variabilis]|uniref:Vacuolar import and degradation protein 21 n=1 Tax=Crepidotus variabilis TaxID=179855 RepID=A0A9P6ENR2_9AGAR|nr:hypothetical protein CPB83DRAFT_807585 [Crepidotus variabilis]
MAQSSNDAQLQDRKAQLNVILSRRNEFLREVFRMTRMREGINAVSMDGEDEEMEAFLSRFDLEKNSENGSISHLTDAEISFPVRATTPVKTHSANGSVDGASSSSTRALRRRSRTDDSAALALERSRAPGALEKAIARNTELSRFSSSPQSRCGPRNMEVDTDEDYDELDLIGPARISDELEDNGHDLRRETKKVLKPPSTGEIPEQSSTRRYTPTPPPIEPPILKHTNDKTALEEEEVVGLPPENLLPDKSREPAQKIEVEEEEEEEVFKENEISTPKDQAMQIEDDEVETVSKSNEEPRVAEQENPATSTEDAPSTNARIDPSDIVTKMPLEQPPEELLRSNQPSSTTSSLPPSPQKVPILPLQVQSSASQDEHAFKMDTSTDVEVSKSTNAYLEVDSMGHFSPTYVLPPLSVLPPDFMKKAKPIKRSKKEKDGKRDKEDAVPLGLAKWSATLMANPLWRKVARATKTLSTREWSVAMAELRLVRTVERIESLKNDGRWSFRQPKKQRGVGGLTKSHWDYLLEEMKWMRTDFREERRWKLALAYNLSTAVLEWHFLKTREDREKAGIIVKWKQLRVISLKESTGELSMDMSSDDLPATTTTKTTAQLLGVDYGSDEEEDEPENQQDILDSLTPSAAVQDVLEAASEIQPKHEDVEDSSALQLMQVADTLDATNEETQDSRPEDDMQKALKSNSDNPLLSGSKSSSQSVNGDSEPVTPMSKKVGKSALNPVRERIVYSDDLFLDIGTELQNLNIKSKSNDPDVQSILDVQLLFPDLQPFGILDVSPGPPLFTTEEKKKKSEKKSDREDPAKRLEDTTYTKLHPTGRFMQSKPTLIGPLQPAKRFHDGKWLPIDPQPVTADLDAKISEDISNGLFEGRPAGLSLQMHGASFNKARRAEQLWTQGDDALLRQLVDRYSSNWALVAECYNSSRLTTTTERRTPVECMERWKERWSAEKKMQAAEPSSAMPSSDDMGSSSIMSSSSQSQMTTRGVKRLASVSVSSAQGVSIGGEKKRRRHYLLQDSIKRAAKKRSDVVQKMLVNQRKPSAVHETHNQYNKLPKLTPLELARMKADRDQRETQDFQLARRRQEEALRANLLREQAQRAAAQGQIGQAPSSQGQAQAAQSAPTQQSAQAAQPAQAPASVSQVQGSQPPQAQQPTLPPQLQPQQLAQLQQLQAQQANQAAGRLNIPAVGIANRPPTRMAATPPNVRVANPQAQAQAQLLQQARMQLPMQFPTAPANLAHVLSQAQAAGNVAAHGTGNPYYAANLSNLTQEQVCFFKENC